MISLRRKLTNKRVDALLRLGKKPVLESNKLAYLAGLIDGEGNIKVEKWGTIRIRLGMTDYKTVKWIHNNFGGRFEKPQVLKSKKKFYTWRSGTPIETLELMIMISPFLITKKFTLIKAMKRLTKRLKAHKAFTTIKIINFNNYFKQINQESVG